MVIHGMGEQRPMETLRGFVETLWERDSSLFAGLSKPSDHANSDTWSKPDPLTGSSELRRITTAHGRDPNVPSEPGIRADFFELHWADITADSTWTDFALWLIRLLWRNPVACEVPKRVLFVWCLLWITFFAVLSSGLFTALTMAQVFKDPGTYKFLSWSGWGWVTVAILIFGTAVKGFLIAYFGDVARYVSASPRNIKVRQAARDRGLKLLSDLHASGKYMRIVIVGHSLGSILAHDLLALAWAEAAGKIQLQEGDPIDAAVAACEETGIDLLRASNAEPLPPREVSRHDRGCICSKTPPTFKSELAQRLAKYRLAQRDLFWLLSKVKTGSQGDERRAWLVSDLVTLGSPLTHASFLLAQNSCELYEMMRTRELLRAPPVYEKKKNSDKMVFTFPSPKDLAATQMHHATAFAPVRWTNLHDATKPWMFLRGDLISGPVAGEYGPGVLDLKVQPLRQGLLGGLFPRLFTHTLYWSYPHKAKGAAPSHIEALRLAVNALDDPASERRLMTLFEKDQLTTPGDVAMASPQKGSDVEGCFPER
ncbi:MAG: hypothetical protein CFE39_03850 [Comamonadaceae bacterium PBBC2]|nr:MAG: hypothetical protein CFE39_03850 [Comamonadaceae bacterium PBBC2]